MRRIRFFHLRTTVQLHSESITRARHKSLPGIKTCSVTGYSSNYVRKMQTVLEHHPRQTKTGWRGGVRRCSFAKRITGQTRVPRYFLCRPEAIGGMLPRLTGVSTTPHLLREYEHSTVDYSSAVVVAISWCESPAWSVR